MHPNPANLLKLDYIAESKKLPKLPFPIIDAHTHINGKRAAEIYKRAAEAYGVSLTYSMTRYDEIDAVKGVLGESIRFITMPTFLEEERFYHDLKGYLKLVDGFYAKGSRIMKFWAAPRGLDIGQSVGLPDMLKLGSPRRKEIMKHAASLNMVFMVHVADPDTWFKAKYSDSGRYGKKPDQYKALEEALEQFKGPWIAAHMGGWPEDLGFLDSLLERHSNLHLDTSATKWMARELSKHSREELISFFSRWRKRILFGSDIVSYETHLDPPSNENRCFDLYASRYFVLRNLFETAYSGPSPIADPDLSLIDPKSFTPLDSPKLSGKSFPRDLLEDIYYKNSARLLGPYHGDPEFK